MLEKLNGYKTKIIVISTILYSITGFILGHLDANQAVAMILAACGGFGIYNRIDREIEGEK